MSLRGALIWILLGGLAAGYVGVNLSLARTVEVVIERKMTAASAGSRFRTGTAHLVETDQGTFGFFSLPWTESSEDMHAALTEGERARLRVIDWLHAPLVEKALDRPARPNIIAVEPL